MENFKLSNGIETHIKINEKTPRIAFCLYMEMKKYEDKAGVYKLLNRLFLQGTKTRSAEELANELEEDAIELSISIENDFARFRIVCLNADFIHAIEILADIISNSTFENLEKEKEKIKGEIKSDLDSPKTLAEDNFAKKIYINHPYSNVRTKILEDIDTIKPEDIIKAYNNLLEDSVKNITVVGDTDITKTKTILEKHFGILKNSNEHVQIKYIDPIKEDVITVVEKEDAKQAQIHKGWIVPSRHAKEYIHLQLLNMIMGSSGLSSRLYLELREKKGLAYVVRSTYETFQAGACFYAYIATEPKNIKTALNGFDIEINKIMTELISDDELKKAKTNFLGKRQFYLETNQTQAMLMGHYVATQLGINYEKELKTKIMAITKQDILETATKCFQTHSVTSVLAPKKYLQEAGLI